MSTGNPEEELEQAFREDPEFGLEFLHEEREERALDALIVSQLRLSYEDEDEEHLPRLTDGDKAALDSLGPDFIKRLLAGQTQRKPMQPGR